MEVWLSFFIIALCSFAVTGCMRRYALTRSVLDIPNERSSHTRPTPRGGGVAIVVVFLFALVWLALTVQLPLDQAIAFLGAGILVAAVGFWDDHDHIPARWRLLSHFIAAVWLVSWMTNGGLNLSTSLPAWISLIPVVFGLVWLLNLYNFMDGIDGIASVEAVSVCLAGAGLCVITGFTAEALLPLSLGGAALGFLLWNFPRAKIFMGDAGSGFLGMMLGGVGLVLMQLDPSLLLGWIILLGVFITDATFTLVHRIIRGQRPHQAHRSHAYQRASRRFGSHVPVTLSVFGINVLWLTPLAALVATGSTSAVLGIAIAYVPLVVLAITFGAGAEDEDTSRL